eukprot:8085055-Pyramimonas_sp.AAC.1
MSGPRPPPAPPPLFGDASLLNALLRVLRVGPGLRVWGAVLGVKIVISFGVCFFHRRLSTR